MRLLSKSVAKLMRRVGHLYLMQLFIIVLIMLIWSCGSKNDTLKKVIHEAKQPIDIEFVKNQMCYNYIFFEEDTIRCPDSVWTVQLKDTSLFILQSYYGSGYGNGIYLHLIRLEQYSYTLLDSIFCYWADDLFTPSNILYNDSLDFFYYIDEGSGTNHHSKTKHLIRVEDNKFVELLSIPLYVSDIDFEAESPYCTSLATSEVEISKQKLVIRAEFEFNNLINDKFITTIRKVDIATFEYSELKKRYVWIKSTNKDFINFWTDKIFYSDLDKAAEIQL